jgi:hypothetical protein
MIRPNAAFTKERQLFRNFGPIWVLGTAMLLPMSVAHAGDFSSCPDLPDEPNTTFKKCTSANGQLVSTHPLATHYTNGGYGSFDDRGVNADNQQPGTVTENVYPNERTDSFATTNIRPQVYNVLEYIYNKTGKKVINMAGFEYSLGHVQTNINAIQILNNIIIEDGDPATSAMATVVLPPYWNTSKNYRIVVRINGAGDTNNRYMYGTPSGKENPEWPALALPGRIFNHDGKGVILVNWNSCGQKSIGLTDKCLAEFRAMLDGAAVYFGGNKSDVVLVGTSRGGIGSMVTAAHTDDKPGYDVKAVFAGNFPPFLKRHMVDNELSKSGWHANYMYDSIQPGSWMQSSGYYDPRTPYNNFALKALLGHNGDAWSCNYYKSPSELVQRGKYDNMYLSLYFGSADAVAPIDDVWSFQNRLASRYAVKHRLSVFLKGGHIGGTTHLYNDLEAWVKYGSAPDRIDYYRNKDLWNHHPYVHNWEHLGYTSHGHPNIPFMSLVPLYYIRPAEKFDVAIVAKPNVTVQACMWNGSTCVWNRTGTTGNWGDNKGIIRWENNIDNSIPYGYYTWKFYQNGVQMDYDGTAMLMSQGGPAYAPATIVGNVQPTNLFHYSAWSRPVETCSWPDCYVQYLLSGIADWSQVTFAQ